MPGETGQEIPSESKLPIVDRQAVHKIFGKGTDDFMNRISNFYKGQPLLEERIVTGFSSLSEEDQEALYDGVGVTAVLLEDSQPRTGGIIPQKISEGAIDATIKSMKEDPKKALTIVEDLFDLDSEVFLALTLVADKLNQSPGSILQGGHLLLKIYNHILEGKKLGNKLGF